MGCEDLVNDLGNSDEYPCGKTLGLWETRLCSGADYESWHRTAVQIAELASKWRAQVDVLPPEQRAPLGPIYNDLWTWSAGLPLRFADPGKQSLMFVSNNDVRRLKDYCVEGNCLLAEANSQGSGDVEPIDNPHQKANREKRGKEQALGILGGLAVAGVIFVVAFMLGRR